MNFARTTHRTSLASLLGAVTLLSAASHAQHRRRPDPVACTAAQHDSDGHCCAGGEEWVPARTRCMCVDGVEACRQAAVAAAPPPSPVAVPMPMPPPPPPSRCPEGMVLMENAVFNLGAAAGQPGDRSETPAHRVTLAPYCIDRTEVTAHRYQECAATGQCAASSTVNFPAIPAPQLPAWNQLCNGNRPDRADHPMNCLDWTQATAYCRSRGGRLPTEAEWEFAARGAETRTYPWGEAPPSLDRVNACDADCIAALARANLSRPAASFAGSDSHAATAPAGAFTPGASQFGVLDMAGNVMEWTGDWFGLYTAAPAIDPIGAPGGTDRVARGGHWYSGTAAALRTTARVPANPAFRLATLGFRCMHAPVEPPPVVDAAPPPVVAPPPVDAAPPRPHHGR
jgi:formylglycine-generating enzyme required for sulfatase activity